MLSEGLSYHLDEGNEQAMPSPPLGLTLTPVAISFQSCSRQPALQPNNKHICNWRWEIGFQQSGSLRIALMDTLKSLFHEIKRFSKTKYKIYCANSSLLLHFHIFIVSFCFLLNLWYMLCWKRSRIIFSSIQVQVYYQVPYPSVHHSNNSDEETRNRNWPSVVALILQPGSPDGWTLPPALPQWT